MRQELERRRARAENARTVRLAFAALLATGFGCTQTVPVQRFTPRFDADWSIYAGAEIEMMNFSNWDWDTSTWYFYSADNSFRFDPNDHVQDYFWNAFHVAFESLGMRVASEYEMHAAVPVIWLRFFRIDEREIRTELHIDNTAHGIVREIRVTAPPVPESQRTPERMERRIYDLTNDLINAVLRDAGFRQAVVADEGCGP